MQTNRRSTRVTGRPASPPSVAERETSRRRLDGRGERLVLADFAQAEPLVTEHTSWRGFTDRVMGGVSSAEFKSAEVGGRRCMRMTGDVTRDSGGGFVQLALYFRGSADGSRYRGIELVVQGNDEDYNVHIRTSDCGWHDESYRVTFHAKPEWQAVRLPWEAFTPNGLSTPLDPSRLERVGLLGWMREFRAELAVGEIALWRDGVPAAA